MKAYLTPLFLAACAVVLAGVYFLIDLNADPAQTGVLYRFQPNEELREITVTNRYGSYTLAKQDGKWVMTAPARYRMNQQKAMLMEQSLLDLRVNRMLAGDEAEYGLDQPAATIEMVSSRNTPHTLYIGNPTPSKAQVYIKDSEIEQVAIADLGSVAQFDGSLDAYRDKEVFSIDKSKIARIDFYKGGTRQVTVERAGPMDWQMTFPFGVPARRVELAQLVAQMQNWSVASYPTGDADLGTLRLDPPDAVLEVTDEAGDTQRLEFGRTENGQVAVRTGGPQDIVNLFEVDVNLDVLSPDRLLFLAPLRTTIDSVSKIVVEYGDKQATFEVDHATEPPRITGNGSEIPYSEFVSFFVKYISLNADGHDNTGHENTEHMTLTTMHTDGSVHTLKLFDRDAQSFFMDVEGNAEFFTSREKVTQLVYFLEAALAANK